MEKLHLKPLKTKLVCVANQNMGKIVYSLFLMTILQTIFCTACVAPILKGWVRPASFEALALFVVSAMIWFTFQFGFQTILIKMVRGDFVTLGFLFWGFKKPRLSLFVVLPFAFFLLAFTAILRFFFSTFLTNFQEIEPSKINEQLFVFVLPFFLFFVAFIILIAIPFAFVFLHKIDNPHKSAITSFLESAKKIVGKTSFFLVALAISASWKQILISLVAFFLSILSATNKVRVLSMIFDFVYIINSTVALAKIHLSVPILYDAIFRPSKTGKILYLEV